MRINLNRYPKFQETHMADFPRLDGGLNLRELNYRLDANESPNMKNLWWAGGVLQCRDGQRYITGGSGYYTGFACAPSDFHGYAVYHFGDMLFCTLLSRARAGNADGYVLLSGLPEAAGTFFDYDGSLFYKCPGGYYRVDYNEDTGLLSAFDMAGEGYVPVILINADPETGGGSAYQPENRLSDSKIVWYDAKENVTAYRLPVRNVEGVERVEVDGVAMAAGTDYTVNFSAGEVVFAAAPAVTDPPTTNGVRITYRKSNAAARKALMDCRYAVAAGDGGKLCVVLAGSTAQPNAVFWNANDAYGMNPAYFPVENYNLCGDASDPVTGFGVQYGELVVFQRRSVGKLTSSVESIDGRDSVAFAWKQLNARTGCNLPGSIRLIGNNLVFANTEKGVCILRSSSPALENNVECFSENVNGSASRGLLHDLRAAGENGVCAADDTARYWTVAGDHAYVWDYENSGSGQTLWAGSGDYAQRVQDGDKPSWYYFTGIRGKAFFTDGEARLYHMDAGGRLSVFERGFTDYGGAIEKVYTFATQSMGGYERRKNIDSLILCVRSDTDTEIALRYDTDFERRVELTPIRSWSWRLTPRNLTRRCLSTSRFGHVERRDPKCLDVRHFSLTLSNNTAGQDLAIVSLRIYFRYQANER